MGTRRTECVTDVTDRGVASVTPFSEVIAKSSADTVSVDPRGTDLAPPGVKKS